MFYSFFQFPSKVEVFIFLFPFFQFYSMVSRDGKVHNSASSLFLLLLIIIRSGRLAEIKWSVYMSKSQLSLCVILQDWCWVVHIPWVRMVNFKLLHNSHWITLLTQSCLVLYSFCANLLHSLIIWLIVSSLSPHNLYLLFSCVLSILTLIRLVLIALFCAAIRRDSVSLLKFTFFYHVHVFSYEMLLISQLKRPMSCFSSHFCFLVMDILLVSVLTVFF